MSPRDRAIERARKLAALARDQQDTPEGATAAKVLGDLRERWQITDEEMIVPDEDEIQIYRILVEFGDPRVRARADLLSVIGHIGDCLVTYRIDDAAWVGRVFSHDLEQAKKVVGVFADVESWLRGRMERHEDGIRKTIGAKMFEHWKSNPDYTSNRVRDWWLTACAVLMREFRARTRAREREREADGRPMPVDKGRSWTEMEAPTAAPETVPGAAPDAQLARVEGAGTGIAVKVAEAKSRIAAAGVTAEPEAWKWTPEAAAAISEMPWPW